MLDSVAATLKSRHSCDDSNYLIMAPAGKAASNASGSTLHSNQDGLVLPVKGSCKELLGEKLARLQQKHEGKLKLMFLDEFAMISQKMLYYADR